VRKLEVLVLLSNRSVLLQERMTLAPDAPQYSSAEN
jgi:hypothetical protein